MPLKRKKSLRTVILCFYLLALIGFSLSLACERTVVCSYVSINGDFQSYNVFRRMLAGQIPYLDFANYIGMAPVWLNLPLVALLGGKFSASLFVTSFTSNLLFSLSVLVIFYLATGSPELSMAVSALCSKLVSTRLLTLLGWPGRILDELFAQLYTPSNSMRVARCFLPFALVLLALIAERLCGTSLLQWLTRPAGCGAVGLVLGFFLPWSSDYGLACIATGLVLAVLAHLLFYKTKRWSDQATAKPAALPCLGLLLAGCAAGAAISAFLVTGGHPAAFWQALGAVGSAQYYYFAGCDGLPVLVYLFRCGEFWAWAAALCLFLVPATVRLARGTLSSRGVLLYYAMAAQLCGTLAYLLSGSGYHFKEALVVYTVLLWLALGAAGLLKLLNEKTWTRAVGYGALGLGCIAGLWLGGDGALHLLGHTETPLTGAYIEALGGYNENTGALIDAAQLTEGEEVFSVYATGLETVLGQFQPTGYDYIIHALGEDARRQYVETFAAGDYRWVQTPAYPVENWLTGQNWPFYRLLYRNYQKTFRTEYSWLWERTGDQTLPTAVEVSVIPHEQGGVTLVCTADQPVNGIAEVQLDYSTSFTGPAAAALCLGRRAVTVGTGSFFEDDTSSSSYTLPGEGRAEIIPVILQDGVGRTNLVGMPQDHITVTVENVRVLDLLPRHTLTGP